MSFRLFIYYCALCGGVGGCFGWLLGRGLVAVAGLLLHAPLSPMLSDGIKAMCVGMVIAAAIGLVDALWVFSLRQLFSICLRVGTAVLIGSLGGLFGGLVPPVVSDLLRSILPDSLPGLFFDLLGWLTDLLTWTITGTLIGISVGTFDVLATVLRGKDFGTAVRKTIKGLIGGALGGAIGGVFSLLLHILWGKLFADKPQDRLWSPSASGFIILGLCIGLFIGLAQIILKEAWLRVEQGLRKGREMILQKGDVTLGRAESCDLGLFGDPLIEKVHARLILQGKQYHIVDAGTASGTFVNEQRISGPTPLRTGDLIRVGKCVLRFGERAKRS